MGLVISCINLGRSHRHRQNANREPDRVSKDSITREEWLHQQERYNAALWELARAADARIQRITDRQEQARKRYLTSLENNANKVSEEIEEGEPDVIDVVQTNDQNAIGDCERHRVSSNSGLSVASSELCAIHTGANKADHPASENGNVSQGETHDVVSRVERNDPREGDTHSDCCDTGGESGKRSMIRIPTFLVQNSIARFKS